MKKLHLRAAGDMNKRKSIRTFCGRSGSVFNVTEYATLVDCKFCLDKLRRIQGFAFKLRLQALKENERRKNDKG